MGRHKYNQGEFEEAIRLFQGVDRQSDHYVYGRFFEGIAHVRTRRAQPAIQAFRAIIEAIDEGVTGVEDTQRMDDLAWLSLAREYSSARKKAHDSSKSASSQYSLPVPMLFQATTALPSSVPSMVRSPVSASVRLAAV